MWMLSFVKIRILRFNALLSKNFQTPRPFIRSAAYLSNGNTEAALADGEAAIKAKSDWPKGYSRKGAALHAMKKYKEAEAVYNAGLAAVPGDATLTAALQEVRVFKDVEWRFVCLCLSVVRTATLTLRTSKG